MILRRCIWTPVQRPCLLLVVAAFQNWYALIWWYTRNFIYELEDTLHKKVDLLVWLALISLIFLITRVLYYFV
jgi:hypothetical protein